mgnify:CR=1 FL=1
MPLKFTDRKAYEANVRIGLCGGWDEYCPTPAGPYTINFLDRMRGKPVFMVQFGCKILGEFATEIEAKTFAQDHFNALVKGCRKFLSE